MRLIKHLFAPSAKRLFPTTTLEHIARAIADSERSHSGEICFAVEPGLHPRAVWAGHQARDRAHEVFAQLRVWDTQANNGVLLFLLLADHRIEIVADRGFQGRVSDEQWRGVCQLVEERLRAGEPEAAVLRGVEALSALLTEHFPRAEGDHDVNELPDLPYVL
jgi:uncharacterized membrane protein